MSTRVLVLSDTHVPDFARALPAALQPALRRAELILHAGDVTSPALLDDLAEFAPTHVALGNGDGSDVAAWGGRPEVRLSVDGVPVAMVHDSGPKAGREPRLRRRFPEARVVVFGHSHIPVRQRTDGVLFLNPGSPTWKRRQPYPTFARLTISGGRIAATVVELPA